MKINKDLLVYKPGRNIDFKLEQDFKNKQALKSKKLNTLDNFLNLLNRGSQ